jgi:hypothetical protein
MEVTVALIVVLILVAAIVAQSAVLDAIAHIPLRQPDRRHRRERRSGRTIGQHIKSVERSMDVTRDPAAKKALQARMDHLQERMRKFFRRKKTDRRHSHGTAWRAFLPRISRAAILASAGTIPELVITASGHRVKVVPQYP